MTTRGKQGRIRHSYVETRRVISSMDPRQGKGRGKEKVGFAKSRAAQLLRGRRHLMGTCDRVLGE